MDKTVRLEVSGTTRPKASARSRRSPANVGNPGHMHSRGRAPHRWPDATALFSRRSLQRENSEYRGSGGVSAENGSRGFAPAFFDRQTSTSYLSRFANGQPAPCHILDGLPDEVVLARSATGRVDAVRPSIVAGFLFQGRFYSREEAARKVAELG